MVEFNYWRFMCSSTQMGSSSLGLGIRVREWEVPLDRDMPREGYNSDLMAGASNIVMISMDEAMAIAQK
jgi:hypothetical protein